MIKGIFCIKDSLTGVIDVELHNNEEEAKRAFMKATWTVYDDDNYIGNISDYDLIFLGEIDIDSADIISYSSKHIMNGSVAVKNVANNLEMEDY